MDMMRIPLATVLFVGSVGLLYTLQNPANTQFFAGLDNVTSGIIAVNEKMMASIDERTQKKIDSIYRPIVISLPIKERLEMGEDHRAYLSRLIRRAIGFDITLRRG